MQTNQPSQSDPGFKLPEEEKASKDPLPKTPDSNANMPIEVAPAEAAPVTDTSSRDLAIGGGVFLVLLIVYFFVRSAYVHHLVVKRVPPSSAGSAGWLLLVGLSFVSAAAVLALINASQFLTFWITAPLVIVGCVALVAAMFVGRR